jgi:thymidylate synthase ThyX
VLLCCERISLLAAKALEQSRLGAAYIELSTRYVDMHGADVYPIAEELACYGVGGEAVNTMLTQSFDAYRTWQGNDFNGPLPTFFREHYAGLVNDEKDLKNDVIGETCDVLGNFLPIATLTSVGIGISGEGFGGLVQKLFLEQTPETWALAELILAEAPKVGANQFAKRYLPTDWDKTHWEYLATDAFANYPPVMALLSATSGRDGINTHLLGKAKLFPSFAHCNTWDDCVTQLAALPRGSHDKLPAFFESVSVSISGLISFRGWRDIHRHVLCTHHRTLVTPFLGFYHYPKPAPEAFHEACTALYAANQTLYAELMTKQVPPMLAQYVLALGNMVGFTLDANLRQFEFMDWQRTSFGVNDEVRAFCLAIEKAITQLLPWWSQVSRASKEADIAHYCFARTNTGIPLP